MSTPVRSVLLVAKADDPSAQALSREVADWLTSRGVECRLLVNALGADFSSQECQADFALVLGGDGTFLSVARKLEAGCLPLLGVNLGRVGFLTELMPGDWPVALERILDQGYEIEERLRLSYRLIRDGVEHASGAFVNDIVVSRGAMARLIRLSVHVSGELLSSFRADGVILATSTGSTAYCVSAGGPVISHRLAVCCVTPICPFLNDFRPLVLPADEEIVVSVDEEHSEVSLTRDGQIVYDLRRGDRIVVNRDAANLRIVRLPEYSFFGALKDKGFYTER